MSPESPIRQFEVIADAPGGVRRLCEAGKVRKPKKLPPIEADEVPFEVPERWAWAQIGATMDLINGRALKPAERSTTGLPIVRIRNLNDENAAFNHCDLRVSDKFYVHDGDLLVSWSGTPGTSFGAFVWRRGPAV